MFEKLPSGHGKSGAQQIPGEMFEFSGASSGLDLNGPPNSLKIISLKFLILHFKCSAKNHFFSLLFNTLSSAKRFTGTCS